MRMPIECRTGSHSRMQRSSNRRESAQADNAHRRTLASAVAGGIRNGMSDGMHVKGPPMTV